MKVLIIKTSSMGDVIHTLPAVTDAAKALRAISFDWIVEENFAEIPLWNPSVKNVIPVAIRRWRKNITSKKTWSEWNAFRKRIQAQHYDAIIDAQGLLKSAFLSYFAKGKKYGFDRSSAREALASLFYTDSYFIEKKQHAITRVRQLFSQVLNYSLHDLVPDYGVDRLSFAETGLTPYLVFLHGTTWTTKHWPEINWIELAHLAAARSLQVKLLWGNEQEKARADRIKAACQNVEVLPKLNLNSIVKVLANAKAVAGVDTGFSHLTAALNVPAVSLYGPTNPALTGALGKNQVHLLTKFACSPCLQRECTYKLPSPLSPACFTTLPPTLVWDELCALL